MFDDRSSGREQPVDCGSDPARVDGLQPIRLSLPAFKGGAWCIPAINAGVPATLTAANSCAQTNAAAFSLEAHAAGVGLPNGKFTTLKDTLRKQLEGYLIKEIGPNDPLSLNLYFQISDTSLKLILGADTGIEVLALRPVVEALNAEREGLGWYVYEAICRGTSNGYPIYKPSDFGSMAEMLWFEPGMTDEEYATHLRHENGLDKSVPDCEVFESYTASGFLPSSMVEASGGHLWMLEVVRWNDKKNCAVPAGKKPKVLNQAQAAAAKTGIVDTRLRSIVEAALELDNEVCRKGSHLLSHWTSINEDSAMYPPNPIGAACALVWDDPHMFMELLQHYEECEMNGGECTDVHITATAELDDPSEVRALVQSFLDLVRRHKALKKVLEHFPEAKYA